MALSTRQTTILEFIRTEIVKKGYPPSVREIGDAVGLASSSTVHGHLDRLEKKGLIRRDPSKSRAIEVVDTSNQHMDSDVVPIPIVGKVTAGEPILAVQDVEDYFVMKRDMVTDGMFGLKVKGESMIEAGIHDGDLLVVLRQTAADNGDMVVAMTPDDEVTVKTFYKEKGYVRLQPENSKMKPIILKDVKILGKVKGVFRIIE